MQNPLPRHDVAGVAFVVGAGVQIAAVFREPREGDDHLQQLLDDSKNELEKDERSDEFISEPKKINGALGSGNRMRQSRSASPVWTKLLVV